MSFSEWQEIKLAEVMNFKNGKKKPNFSGDIPIYGGNGILGYTNKFNNDNAVVIGRVGAYCGSVYYEPYNCWVSDNAISAKPLGDNSVKYAYYALQSLKLNERRIGTGQPLLTQSILNNIVTIYPRVNEQEAIADTLSRIDEKIEINNRMNKTLEEMAQAIFKCWFVDFDPFQDGEFEDSDLGRIPKGWRVISIQDYVSDIKNGGTPSRKKEEYWCSDDIPWIKTGEIRNASIISCEEFISQEGFKNSSAKLLPKNTVLLAMYGATAGKVGLLRFEATTNQACCAMICESINKSICLYLYLLQNQTYIESLAVGAAQQNLSKDAISKLRILLPCIDIVDRLPFEEIFNVIENNLRQNQNLTSIRDTLLPKLMSGEIRVPIEEAQNDQKQFL